MASAERDRVLAAACLRAGAPSWLSLRQDILLRAPAPELEASVEPVRVSAQLSCFARSCRAENSFRSRAPVLASPGPGGYFSESGRATAVVIRCSSRSQRIATDLFCTLRHARRQRDPVRSDATRSTQATWRVSWRKISTSRCGGHRGDVIV